MTATRFATFQQNVYSTYGMKTAAKGTPEKKAQTQCAHLEFAS
jgi:hypothetical protein